MIDLAVYLDYDKTAFTKALRNNSIALNLLDDLNKIFDNLYSNNVELIKKFAELRKYLVVSEYEKKQFIKLADSVFNVPKKKVQRIFNIVDNILPIENFIWEDYQYSQLVELLPLANATFKEYLLKVNSQMSCSELRKYVKRITKVVEDKEEEILKQQESFDIDVSKFDLKNAFAITIEKFQYARQDVKVIVNFIAEQLNIDVDKLFNM